MIFKKTIEVRWSDIDANQHVTHTAYATFATHTRVEWMASAGCSMKKLLELGFGAVLLKEQTEYFREILLGEQVTVELYFAGENENHSRWKFVHKLYNSKGKMSALHTVYGAWIDSNLRKIYPPPAYLLDRLKGLEKSEDFEILTLGGIR
jgi:acyl-CoA thioester hydrolase